MNVKAHNEFKVDKFTASKKSQMLIFNTCILLLL